jgi:hypothetical protein
LTRNNLGVSQQESLPDILSGGHRGL